MSPTPSASLACCTSWRRSPSSAARWPTAAAIIRSRRCGSARWCWWARTCRTSPTPTTPSSRAAGRSWCVLPRRWQAPRASCCRTRPSSPACAVAPTRRWQPSRARCRARSRRCCASCRAKKAWRVRLDEPSWWYAPAPGRLAMLLQPLGAIYGRVAEARYFRTTPYRSRLPVICIGNFTSGGTGKTPLAIHLCERLKAAGHEPAVLTRGYGGRLSGPYWVNAASDVARDVGDEALLLARAAPTLVARDRRAGAHAIEMGPHPVTVIVMDDGLQNPGLAKDLTIAVVDGGRGLGNGLTMPAGPLRAPLPFQLELTDAIVVNESSAATGG